MVKIISGERLKDMIVGAATLLDNHKDSLNALNVFPVPDGDTGTNMSLTMISAAKEVVAANIQDYKAVINALSIGSLKGARGNSGVILSQIWRGFSAVLCESNGEISAHDIAFAMQKGTECAYKAIMKPKEGTILTVAKAMAEAAVNFTKDNDNIREMLQYVLIEGEATLKRTPDMLPVLKEAGVVDAGGAGLIIIFRGFKKVLDGEAIEESETIDFETDISMEMEVSASTAEIEFGYCTEFFINNIFKHILQRDVDAFRHSLSKIGDCVLVVGDLNLLKVHVHTNDPGIVLQNALTMGALSKIKIDNMREQHRELESMEAVPQTKLKPMAVVSVVSGEGLKEILRDSLVDEFVEGGQTMNPSTQDILSAVNKASSDNIIILPNNKNIILAAEQAAELSSKNVVVVPSKTLPQGISAALSYNCEEEFDINVARMKKALGNVKTGQITTAVRDSSINGFKIKKDEFIGIGEDEILSHGEDIQAVSIDLLDKLVDEDTGVIAVYYGEGVQEEDAAILEEKIAEKYEYSDIELHYGGQSVYSFLFAVE